MEKICAEKSVVRTQQLGPKRLVLINANYCVVKIPLITVTFGQPALKLYIKIALDPGLFQNRAIQHLRCTGCIPLEARFRQLVTK